MSNRHSPRGIFGTKHKGNGQTFKCKPCEAMGVETPRLFKSQDGAKSHLESYHGMCPSCNLLHPKHVGGCLKCNCGWQADTCDSCMEPIAIEQGHQGTKTCFECHEKSELRPNVITKAMADAIASNPELQDLTRKEHKTNEPDL